MKNHNKYKIFFLALLVVGFIMPGCEKDEELSDTPDQLFRPISFAAAVNGVDINFSWVPIANAKYILEISKDSLLFTNELQQIEILDSIEYRWENLVSRTQYSARIKAVSKDGSVKDSGYRMLTFKTGVENIFFAVSTESVGLDYVKIEWNKEKIADKIVVSDQDSTVLQTVMLTSDHIETGELLLENLEVGTKYIFQVFNGEILRGTTSVRTYALNYTVELDYTSNAGWKELGTYYLLANSGAFTRIRNDGTSGHVIADAFKFTKGDYEIIVDNLDEGVSLVGSWTASSFNPTHFGDNYFHDGNGGKGEKSITYTPVLPESGAWTVSIFSYSSATLANNAPVDIYAGDI